MVIEAGDSRRHRAHYDVTVMIASCIGFMMTAYWLVSELSTTIMYGHTLIIDLLNMQPLNASASISDNELLKKDIDNTNSSFSRTSCSNNNFDDNTKTDVDAIAYQYHGLNSEDVPLRRDCLLACSSPPGKSR